MKKSKFVQKLSPLQLLMESPGNSLYLYKLLKKTRLAKELSMSPSCALSTQYFTL